jgi:hypothetical protein
MSALGNPAWAIGLSLQPTLERLEFRSAIYPSLFISSGRGILPEGSMGLCFRRWIVLAAGAILIASIGAIQGCSGADAPKLADAPPVETEAPKEPPKIPGQKKAFTKVDGYSKYMSKGGQTVR